MSSTDERRPLLPNTTDESAPLVPSYSQQELEPEQDSPTDGPKDDDLDWRWYTFYSVLILGGSVILGLLIKGFIDGGDTDFDLKGALKSALGGGLSGAAAMVLQVLTLMPLRTIMNYQYRYGTSTLTALHTLYNAGGYARYYQGLSAALIQGPVSRFGDTAANAGIIALLNSNPTLKAWPELLKSVFASVAAAAFRIILTPIDTVKTTLQTQGQAGWAILRVRVKQYGIGSLWYGALATAAATFVGHYPWFATYNFLSANLPPAHSTFANLSRRAFIGFVASVVSDTSSNSLRVLKTYRQVNQTRIGYVAAAREVVRVDGVKGLFGRGLKTRILANGLQGIMFTVLWGWFMDIWKDKTS